MTFSRTIWQLKGIAIFRYFLLQSSIGQVKLSKKRNSSLLFLFCYFKSLPWLAIKINVDGRNYQIIAISFCLFYRNIVFENIEDL